jgi:Beta-lactamase inhibitor (BLIP)
MYFVMKKIFKFGCLSVIGLIVLVIVIAVASGGDDSASPASTTKTNSTKTSEGTESSNNKEGISKEEFEQVKDGMTYEEVVKVVGVEGELLSETGEKGSQFHTIMYSWEGANGWGANANMTFQNEKLVSKAQFGVGGGSDVEVSLEQFNKIQNGMTYEQVTEILGGEGELSSTAGDAKMYSYAGKGDIGANAILSFQANKLINKTQMGLK